MNQCNGGRGLWHYRDPWYNGYRGLPGKVPLHGTAPDLQLARISTSRLSLPRAGGCRLKQQRCCYQTTPAACLATRLLWGRPSIWLCQAFRHQTRRSAVGKSERTRWRGGVQGQNKISSVYDSEEMQALLVHHLREWQPCGDAAHQEEMASLKEHSSAGGRLLGWGMRSCVRIFMRAYIQPSIRTQCNALTSGMAAYPSGAWTAVDDRANKITR